MRHRLDIQLLSAFVIGFALATSALAQPADLALRGGNVITVDNNWRIAQAIAIKDGRFLAVGDDAAIAGHIGPNTQVIELAGKTVVPGLIDSHLHQLFAALNGPAVQLLGSRAVADVQKAIAERVARSEPGKWVMASSGWHESILEEGRMPTRYELDQVSPDNPVFIPRGGHVITVNSKALELAGITKGTPNPDGGVIVRDVNGEATGVLLETAAYLVRKILPPPPSNMAELLKIAMRDLNSYGIVGVIEPGIDERQMALYRAMHDSGDMTVRTDVLYRALRKVDVEKGIAAIKAQKNDDMLRFVGIKFPLDGGVEGGRMSWPYRLVTGEQTDAAYRGVLLLPPGGEDEYVEGLKLIAEAGLQAQTHAVGDETIDMIVRSYERVNREKPIRDLRWTIMHLFHPSDAALRRMAEIGIMATMQSSRSARPQPAPLVGRRACRLCDPDPQDDRRGRAGRWRHRRAGGASRSVPVDVVDDDTSGAEGLRARQGARDHREGGADALHHQQRAHHGRGKGAWLDRAGQACRSRGAVAGHLGRCARRDPRHQGADDGGGRQSGLSEWDLTCEYRNEARSVSRFRSSHMLAATSDANFGIKETLVRPSP
jgi:predicted amidohydrolase YtcJ